MVLSRTDINYETPHLHTAADAALAMGYAAAIVDSFKEGTTPQENLNDNIDNNTNENNENHEKIEQFTE